MHNKFEIKEIQVPPVILEKFNARCARRGATLVKFYLTENSRNTKHGYYIRAVVIEANTYEKKLVTEHRVIHHWWWNWDRNMWQWDGHLAEFEYKGGLQTPDGKAVEEHMFDDDLNVRGDHKLAGFSQFTE